MINYVQVIGPGIPNGESEMLIAWLDALIRDGEHELAREVLTDAYSWAYMEHGAEQWRQMLSTQVGSMVGAGLEIVTAGSDIVTQSQTLS